MGDGDFLCFAAFFFLLYVTVGAILGKVCRNQPGMGALLAILCGPFGWLLIALITDNRRRCQECHGRIPTKEARRCMHCGSELRHFAPAPGILDIPLFVTTTSVSRPSPSPPPKPPPASHIPQCGKCGSKMDGVIEHGEARLICPKCDK